VLLQKLDDTISRHAAFTRVVNLLRESFPTPTPLQQANAEIWPLTLKVLQHLLRLVAVFSRIEPRIAGNLPFAELLADVVGMDLLDHGFTGEVQTLSRAAEDVLNHLQYPLETTLRGNILAMLGLCYDPLGITGRAEGLKVRRKNLIVRERCFGNMVPSSRHVDDEIWLLQRLYRSLLQSSTI